MYNNDHLQSGSFIWSIFNFYSGPIYNCTIFQAAVCNPVSCDDHFGLSELSPECACVLREMHRTQKSYVGVCEGCVEEV